jgi:tripartite-type tricarboxylate transporter receptor subunit TctC
MRIIEATAATALLFAAVASASPGTAQDYPTRVVRVISTTPPGGPQDFVARAMANHFSEVFGKPFIVEDRSGGNSIIGTQYVWDAPADGHTLLNGSDVMFSINPYIHSHLPYDPAGFIPIALLVTIPQQIYVNANLPVNTLDEFIAYAKARTGQLNYASIGVGSTPHLAIERLMQATGVDLVHVPFAGSADAFVALVSDQIQVMVAALSSGLPLLASHQVKALATGGSEHFSELPGVPTFIEAGYPQLDFQIWYGLMAKKGTPQPIIDRLDKESIEYVNSDKFRNEIAPRNRWTVNAKPQAEFAKFLRENQEIYRKAIEYSKMPMLD